MLNVTEIFRSIQGESTRAGCVCSFVRLSGCNLACTYCDTTYAREPGTEMEIDEVQSAVAAHGTRLVEITGGEPLLQEAAPELCWRFIDSGYTVLVETNGTCDISRLPQGVLRIMDIKCPGSGMAGHLRLDNIAKLRRHDEVKFVISDREDFRWALEFVVTHGLHDRCPVLFSPVHGKVEPRDLAEWILVTNAPVRLGLQLHKFIWGPTARGV